MFITTKNIIHLMEEKNLNARQFELTVGLSNASIQAWRNGKNNPSTKALEKIANYFDLPLSYFYEEHNEPIKETATTENLFKIKKAPESLSEDEQELLKQYKGLDSHSKAALLELAKNLNINKSNTERKIK